MTVNTEKCRLLETTEETMDVKEILKGFGWDEKTLADNAERVERIGRQAARMERMGLPGYAWGIRKDRLLLAKVYVNRAELQ